MLVQFRFDGRITVTVPYHQLPSGLLGQGADAVTEWVQEWLRQNAPAITLKADRVYLPRFGGVLETVSLAATGEWRCPRCGAANQEYEFEDTVYCECGRAYEVSSVKQS